MTVGLVPQDLFIDGTWRAGSGQDRFPVLNPATGEVVARFADASVDDCRAAVDAAARASAPWAATSARDRSDILSAVSAELRAQPDVLADIIVRENGKSWTDAVAEVRYSAEFFRWFAEEAVRVRGDYSASPTGDKRVIVTHGPIGVSLLITPWNFPAAMAARKLAPALAAGCTTVLKPAIETPLAAAHLTEMLHRAGAPAGVVNLVTPTEVGPAVSAMIHDPRVRKLSFTGSTAVGRHLLREAADQVVSCAMELGGNAPLIVLPGADVAAAVEGTIDAKLRNGGAACTAADRLYVHDSLHDEFVRLLRERFATLTMGPGTDRGNHIGALVSEAEARKVARLVADAVDDGAHLVLGETQRRSGCFYPPTILTDVRHGSAISATEIFGPVAAIVRFADTGEAVRMANDAEYGLAAYVFGPEAEALRVAGHVDAGMVGVNIGRISDPFAPFGGVKQSGLGREGGSVGIHEFLEEKYIALPA
ncbi:NAD-dependent succinate-semialdehyde dehydrogenase [Microbacterium sp. NPDC077184]|uniref:NAD-dependent succinate-semialdehyde dehydrogenase n=1 Tax=Microbacterium sp. NPDC077184 TaxID=3154764 RepID=UPI003417CC6E